MRIHGEEKEGDADRAISSILWKVAWARPRVLTKITHSKDQGGECARKQICESHGKLHAALFRWQGRRRSRNQPKKFFSTRKLKWNVARLCKNLVASRRPLDPISIEAVVHISEGNYIWCPNKNTAKPYGDALVYTLHSLLIDKGCLTSSKTDEFSEKFQTAFDPPPLIFGKSYCNFLVC